MGYIILIAKGSVFCHVQSVALFTYGVYNIDFYAGNDYLDLKEGATAELTLPLFDTTHEDGSTIAVGDSIPLLRLNEQTGKWIFESNATVIDTGSGLALRGTVTGFSAYNMDRPRNNNYWNLITVGGGEFVGEYIDGGSYDGPTCVAIKYRHTGPSIHYSDDVVCVGDSDKLQRYTLQRSFITGYCWDMQLLQPGVTTFNWNNQNTVQEAGTTTFCHNDTYSGCAGLGLSGNSVADERHCGTLSNHIGFEITVNLALDGLDGNYILDEFQVQRGALLNSQEVLDARAAALGFDLFLVPSTNTLPTTGVNTVVIQQAQEADYSFSVVAAEDAFPDPAVTENHVAIQRQSAGVYEIRIYDQLNDMHEYNNATLANSETAAITAQVDGTSTQEDAEFIVDLAGILFHTLQGNGEYTVRTFVGTNATTYTTLTPEVSALITTHFYGSTTTTDQAFTEQLLIDLANMP